MLFGVQVEHELGERPMQACQLAAQDGKARAGKLGGDFAIEPALVRTELDVILDREIERARRAPTILFDVAVLVGTLRHRGIGQIRNAQRDRGELLLDVGQARFVGLELIGDTGDLGHQRGGVLALALGDADRLGARIARVLQFLGLDLHGLALRLE